jgi:diguanylate cyclase (GGDEF)-like protein
MLAVSPVVPHHLLMAGCGVCSLLVVVWAWLTPAAAGAWVRQAYSMLSVPVCIGATAGVELDTHLHLGPTVLFCPILLAACLRRARHAVTILLWCLASYLAYLLATQPPAIATVGFLGGGLVMAVVAVLAITLRGALDRVVAELQQQAQRDPLTGLLNRFGLREALTEWTEVEASVILMDLDNFKRINDVHGHQEGDDALTWFASLLSRSLRPGDCCARMGGEEFVAIVHGRDARSWADELRLATAAGSPTRPVPFTVSAGLAYGRLDDLPALLSRADEALYRAKGNGRNRVECEALAH